MTNHIKMRNKSPAKSPKLLTNGAIVPSSPPAWDAVVVCRWKCCWGSAWNSRAGDGDRRWVRGRVWLAPRPEREHDRPTAAIHSVFALRRPPADPHVLAPGPRHIVGGWIGRTTVLGGALSSRWLVAEIRGHRPWHPAETHKDFASGGRQI